jgi:nicotinamide mononucleotide (NMN) deamidase PncC
MVSLQSLMAGLRVARGQEDDLPARVVAALRARGWTVAFAESCTGGQLAADLTTVPGSSEVVVGSAVCYQLRAKHTILGLTDVTEQDVVSSMTAMKMAEAARRIFGADVGVGTTGYLDGERRAFWALAIPIGDGLATVLSGSKTFSERASRAQNRRGVCHDVLDYLLTTAGST